MRRSFLLTCLVGLLTAVAFPQTGVRYDNIILSSTGQPLAGVTITTYSDSACTVSRVTYTNQALSLPVGGNATVTTSSLGNFGWWTSPGTMYYTVTSRYITDTSCHPLTLGGGLASVVAMVNVVTDCGLVADNVTDDLAAMNTCLATNKSAHYIFPGCSFNPAGGGTANVPCYYFSGQIVANYNGTWLDGANPSVWNGIVSLRFPTGTGGVRFDKNCYGCKLSNLGLVGPDTWSSTVYSSWPDWTPALLTGNGADGLQLLGGEPLVENVAIYGFGRHGIFIDGSSSISSPSQPDAFTIRNVIVDGNRAYGIHAIGCDSNVGVGTKILSRGNMLAGLYDYSCLGNTWIAPDSALDGRSAISAGATSNNTSVSVSGTTMTVVTATAVSGWTSTAWVTVAGTVNCNGTFKVTGGTSSNFTATYPSGACTSEVVGTTQKASSASVFATLTARSAAAGQAPIIECAYGSRSGSSNQVWVNPYQESNSAPPCWDTGTLVVGGQLVSAVAQATGQGFTWLQNSGGGLLVNGGQAFTLKQPADSLTTLNLRAGATTRQNVALKFMSFDASVKHTIQSTSAGALTFTDTTCLWMQKTEGGTLLIRGCSTNEDLTFQQSSGRDELHYCGTATVCGKYLNSDSGFYVLNGVRPFTAGGAAVGSGPLPFSSAFIGAAATNNAQITGTFTAARVVTIADETQTLVGRIATVDATAQTAAITTTTLYAVPSTGAGQYRLGWNAKVTTAAGVSSTLGALTIVYTDPDGVAQTITAPATIAAGTIATTSTGNTAGTVLIGMPLTLNCKASTNITYAFAYVSNAAAAMAFNLHITLNKQ